LTPACAGLLELRGGDLNCSSLRLMLKISYAYCLGLSPALWRNLLLKSVSQPEIAKNTKTLYYGDSRSLIDLRSSILMHLNSFLPVLVMIGMCLSATVFCNLGPRRTNDGKITTFCRGNHLSRPRLRGTLSPSGIKICRKKLEFLGQLQ